MRTLLAALGVLALVSTSWAIDPEKPAKPTDPASRGVANEAKDVPLRASDINGMKVINPAGKELGTVSDLVIDISTGKIRYAALSYGGFLGVGNKLFAVPWNHFSVSFDPGSKKYYLSLNIPEDRLKSAPGFDSNHWPTFADPKFAAELEAHYRGTSAVK